MNDLTQKNGNGTVARREGTREEQRYVAPAVDILENENGLTLLADMPGVNREQIEVTVENGVLTIKATVPEKDEKGGEGYREYKVMSYFRQFELSEKIDQEKIRADYRNGVLKLLLPLAEKAKPRRVEISMN